MNSILVACDDLDLHTHHRSQMEAAGLQRVLELLQSLNHTPLNKLLKIFQQTVDEGEKKLRERLDQEVLRSQEDSLKAIQARIGNLEARDYLSSTLQHLLLIREDGHALTRYYQLIDKIVTGVVVDKGLAGQSVEQIIARFTEADQLQTVGDDWLIGKLKGQIAQLEGVIKAGLVHTICLQGSLETQRVGYEGRIAELEAQIMELSRMPKDTGKDVEEVFQPEAGGLEIQRRVNEMDKANLFIFHPCHPKSNLDCSV